MDYRVKPPKDQKMHFHFHFGRHEFKSDMNKIEKEIGEYKPHMVSFEDSESTKKFRKEEYAAYMLSKVKEDSNAKEQLIKDAGLHDYASFRQQKLRYEFRSKAFIFPLEAYDDLDHLKDHENHKNGIFAALEKLARGQYNEAIQLTIKAFQSLKLHIQTRDDSITKNIATYLEDASDAFLFFWYGMVKRFGLKENDVLKVFVQLGAMHFGVYERANKMYKSDQRFGFSRTFSKNVLNNPFSTYCSLTLNGKQESASEDMVLRALLSTISITYPSPDSNREITKTVFDLNKHIPHEKLKFILQKNASENNDARTFLEKISDDLLVPRKVSTRK